MDAEKPFGDGAAAILFYAFVASLWAFRRQLLEFTRKRNSGLRTEVALKLRLPSSHAVAAEIHERTGTR